MLVHNAGLSVADDPLTLDAGAIECMIDVNLPGTHNAAVAAARKMPDGGRVILID